MPLLTPPSVASSAIGSRCTAGSRAANETHLYGLSYRPSRMAVRTVRWLRAALALGAGPAGRGRTLRPARPRHHDATPVGELTLDEVAEDVPDDDVGLLDARGLAG